MAYTAAELKLLNTLALQTATAIENARLFERTIQAARERERLLALHQEAELARAKLESEMKLAARIQADLFPAALPQPHGYELAARNRPARRCGGDYYDALTPSLAADGDAPAAVRRRRRRQGPAGGAGDEQHAGDAARAARAHRVAAGAGRARQRPAVRLHVAGEVRDRGARGARRPTPAACASSAPAISTTSSCARTDRSCRWPPPARRSACCRRGCRTARPRDAATRATRWCCSPTASPTRRTRR